MKSLSRVQLFATPWTVAHQALCPWDSPGKNTGVGCHFLLQGDRKANLVSDIQSQEQLKEKKQLEMFRPAQCSLYLVCSQERKEKSSFLFFSFSLQPFLLTATSPFPLLLPQTPKKGSCLQRRPRRPGGGEAGPPAIRRGACRTTGSIGLLSQADCKGPHFLKQQKSPPPSLSLRWARRSRPLPDLGAGPQQAGPPGPARPGV